VSNMDFTVDIIKHDGKRSTEKFDRSKLHASIMATCLSARTPEGQAKTIASSVCDEVEKWLRQHPEVTSRDIRATSVKHLKRYHPEAAYLHEQHHLII